MGTLNLEECGYQYYTQPRSSARASFGRILSDITLHPNGKLYTISTIDDQFGIALYEFDLIQVTLSQPIKVFPLEGVNSLTCDQDGTFYFGFDKLYSYSLETDEFRSHGKLPGDKELAGDLVFYDGQLYGGVLVSSYQRQSEILQINIDSPEESETYMALPDSLLIVGLTKQWDVDCEGTFVIGNSFTSKDDLTQVYHIDLPNRQIQEICQLDLPDHSIIWGLTSSDEFRNNCRLRLDLDRNNSTGRLLDHFQIDSFCTVNFPIADVDISIQSDFERIDSLTITITDGIQHPGQEVLFIPNLEQFIVTGRGSDKLVLINNGNAQLADFEAAISQVRFQIQAVPADNGERQIDCLLYAEGTVSDPAKAFIQVTLGQSASAGEDAYVEACDNIMGINLFEKLGGNPRGRGYWSPPLFDGNRFSGIHDTSGVYHYIVQEGNCPPDSAAVSVLKHEALPIGISGTNQLFDTITTCPGDTIFWDITHPDAIAYFWIDLYNQPVRPLTEPGRYFVDVVDKFNCSWFARTTLIHEAIEVSEIVSLCDDEVFPWNGELIQKDTSLCAVYQTLAGCDSTHCFQIEFNPNYQQNESWTFCEGEVREIQGVTISRDTSFCTQYLTRTGCDSTICTSVSFQAPIENIISVERCEGESYLLGDQILTASGDYRATLMTANGCDSLVELALQFSPHVVSSIDTLIYEDEQISIGNESFTATGQYEVLLSTEAGCDSLIVLDLEVAPLPSSNFFTPTLISPRNSQWGNVFTIYTRLERPAVIKQLHIYDVQGRLVFKRDNTMVGDESQAWRGISSRDSPSSAALYFFTATVEDHFGNIHYLKNKFLVVE